MLLSRDSFRNSVFKRDNYNCVICKASAVDAHHIIERRLFKELFELGGYFIDNGASVCQDCHIKCEETLISPQELREKIGIKKVILPSHLYDDQIYDKWGNIILSNGQRLRGELFWDESVQKILNKVLNLFTHYVKYPRTYHLPWSLGLNEDDRVHSGTNQWINKEVVITVKMDGENTTLYKDYIHARSLDSRNHSSRNWVKNFWASIAYDIPESWRICGENLYAKHSIGYSDLSSFFLGFSLWDDKNYCRSWSETLEFFELIGIHPVQTIYDGLYNEELIKNIKMNYDFQEGYVLRTKDGFSYSDFHKYVGKFVRPNHVQTTKHWMHGSPLIPNILKGLNE